MAVVLEYLDFCDEIDVPTIVTSRPANDGRDAAEVEPVTQLEPAQQG